MTTYSLMHNAKAAALRMVAQGTAPSLDFEILPAEDGRFAVRWGEPLATAASQPAEADDAEPALVAEEPGEAAGDEPEEAAGELEAEATGGAAKRGTALAKVIALLKRPEGATISEIQAATGWLPHTTRAFISVSVKRKAGLDVVTEKVDGRGRVYRVAA